MTSLPHPELPAIGLLFETSWEVCNKIGGIYTVLSTKAKALQALYKDKVIFVGPDVWTESNPSPYFKENSKLLQGAAEALNGKIPHGISIRTGRWDVPGQPIVILVKFDTVYPSLDAYYARAWERFGVDSLHAYGDYPEGCAFSLAAAMTIAGVTAHLKANERKTIAHFDEWTTAMGLLYLEDAHPEIATVFTTHATSIGRSICGNGKPLYDYFHGYNGDQMASELNMQSKHSLEKAAAHYADCFTTVSEVTAAECAQLLDKAPDVVTPNGFEPKFVPGAARRKQLRAKARERMTAIARALTGRCDLTPDNTFIVATSGRNEYRNKGIDLYIDAMERIRTHHNAAATKYVLAFILVPAWVNAPRRELLEKFDAKNACKPVSGNRFLTHTLHNEDSDAITCRLNSLGVNTISGSNVSFIFLPCYLDGKDGILDIAYYDLMPGLDATVFPSYYEPWGYTPLESIAFGVPTVSTDKAGFGQWILSNYDNSFKASGCHVVARTDSNYDEAAEAIAKAVVTLADASDKEIQQASRAASSTAADADWSIFIEFYLKAYADAFSKRDLRVSSK